MPMQLKVYPTSFNGAITSTGGVVPRAFTHHAIVVHVVDLPRRPSGVTREDGPLEQYSTIADFSNLLLDDEGKLSGFSFPLSGSTGSGSWPFCFPKGSFQQNDGRMCLYDCFTNSADFEWRKVHYGAGWFERM